MVVLIEVILIERMKLEEVGRMMLFIEELGRMMV